MVQVSPLMIMTVFGLHILESVHGITGGKDYVKFRDLSAIMAQLTEKFYSHPLAETLTPQNNTGW